MWWPSKRRPTTCRRPCEERKEVPAGSARCLLVGVRPDAHVAMRGSSSPSRCSAWSTLRQPSADRPVWTRRWSRAIARRSSSRPARRKRPYGAIVLAQHVVARSGAGSSARSDARARRRRSSPPSARPAAAPAAAPFARLGHLRDDSRIRSARPGVIGWSIRPEPRRPGRRRAGRTKHIAESPGTWRDRLRRGSQRTASSSAWNC